MLFKILTLTTLFISYVSASWTSYGVSTWDPRDSASLIKYGDNFLMVGGVTRKLPGNTNVLSTKIYNEVWSKTTDPVSPWYKVSTNTNFSPKYAFAAFVANSDIDDSNPTSSIIIAGGKQFNENGTVVVGNDVWRSDNGGVDWQFVGYADWTPRQAMASCNFHGKLFVIGGAGIDEAGKEIKRTDIWSSADLGKTWQIVTSKTDFPPRADFLCVTINNDMYIIAGENNPTVFNDLWKSSDEGKTWQLVNSNCGFSKRFNNGFLTDGKNLIVFGGRVSFTDPYLSDMWISSDLGKSWSPTLQNGWDGRTDTAHIIYNNQIYMYGGRSLTQNYNDQWIYKISQSSDNGNTVNPNNSENISDSQKTALIVSLTIVSLITIISLAAVIYLQRKVKLIADHVYTKAPTNNVDVEMQV
jgi:hypothetical protein